MPEAVNTPVEPLVRVYNKRAHTIISGSSRASPNSFATVPKSVAEAWMKQWPEGVVSASDAQAEVNGALAQANELREKLVASEAENARLKARLEKKGGNRSGSDLV